MIYKRDGIDGSKVESLCLGRPLWMDLGVERKFARCQAFLCSFLKIKVLFIYQMLNHA